MNVRKRGLALLMCICMIFTLLPFSAFAEGTQPFTVTKENSVPGAVMRKTVTQDSSNPDKYTVTLEQWATGTVSTKPKPLDIVLVLDVSGSMDEWFGSGLTKKIDSLKKSANNFIDSIAKKATDDNVDHKIAIVKFAGDVSDNVGNDTYFRDGYKYNYTQIVKNLTEANGNVDELEGAINSLQPAGATAADLGLEKAKEAFVTETGDSSRQRVVIMFTDGEPNYYSGFDDTVAKDAIGHAKSLKNSYNSLVYTIGIFRGAAIGTSLPNDGYSGRTNRYMHLVSSNYPNAEDMSTTGDGDVNSGYYKVAANADDLQKAFDNISTTIGQSGSNLNSTAVLTDMVAPNFNAPKNASEVKVYTADYNGTSFNNKRTEYTGATVNIGENGAVTVTGFDYSANFVSAKPHPGTVNYGKKLIVEFTVTVDRTKTYGGTQPTNAGANIVLDNETIISVDDPKVPVSIDYEFKPIADKTKTYDGSGFNIGDEIGGMLKDNPKADGNLNKYVNITYTITDKDGHTIGTYTIPAGQSTGTWTSTPNAATTTPADAGTYKYTVTCTMSDATPGANSAKAVERTGTANFVINPKAVTVTAEDKSKTYGDVDPELTAKVEGTLDGDIVEYTLNRVAGENVGTYPINASGEEVQGNYTVTYNPGTLTITKAGTLTVSGKDYTGIYDGNTHGDAATASVTEGTTIEYKVGTGEWTTTVPTIKDVGSVTVTVRATNPNYVDAETTTYTLTVMPKAVTVTADNKSKTYGADDPDLTAKVEGTLDGDIVEYTLNRVAGENVGT